jgi:hypothetical protein
MASTQMAERHQLKSFDDLLAQAEHYANWAMRQIGNVPPTMMGLSPRGPLFFVPSGLTDDRAKDNFADTARLICVAHDATAAVMILESWMKLAAPGETLDTTERPSEAIDRREVVLITGETRTSHKQKILPIIRTDVGGFFGFGEYEGLAPNSFEGRFAQILPPKRPTKEMRNQTRMVLAAIGLTDSVLRNDPTQN